MTDTQLYVAMDVADANEAVDRLTSCTAAVKRWFLLNDLLLNADKSDIVVVGTAQQLRSAVIPDRRESWSFMSIFIHQTNGQMATGWTIID